MASTTNSTAKEPHRSTSRQRSETSSTSLSCYLPTKRKHPLASSIRPYVSKNNNSTVKQRVLSARLLKLRSLQNQLNTANYQLADLESENKALRNMQFRQDKALTKYEGRTADLPKLLQSHEEEVRVLDVKNKNLKKKLKDVTDQLKLKEEEVTTIREQLKNLTVLLKNKNLPERQALADQNEELKEKLKESDDQINLLNRKLLLETKNCKHKMNAEISKTKGAQKDLAIALSEIRRLSGLVENKPKPPTLINRKKLPVGNQGRLSKSTISLENSSTKEDIKFDLLAKETALKAIMNRSMLEEFCDIEVENETPNTASSSIEQEVGKEAFTSDVMVSPSENIKARLSAGSNSDVDEVKKVKERVNFSDNVTKNHLIKTKPLHRQGSFHKLEKITTSTNNKGLINNTDKTKKQLEIEEKLDDYCQEMKSAIGNISQTINQHQEDYEISKTETEKLLLSLQETDKMNAQLRYSSIISKETLDIPVEDEHLANQIWQEEFDYQNKFGKREKTKDGSEVTKSNLNGDIKHDAKVAIEHKNKLLAALRAIDNGEEINDIPFDVRNSHKKHTKILENVFDD